MRNVMSRFGRSRSKRRIRSWVPTLYLVESASDHSAAEPRVVFRTKCKSRFKTRGPKKEQMRAPLECNAVIAVVDDPSVCGGAEKDRRFAVEASGDKALA